MNTIGDQTEEASRSTCRAELFALLKRLVGYKRSVREAAVKELETLPPAAVGELSMLIVPECTRRALQLVFVAAAMYVCNAISVPWLREHNFADWYYLVVGVPFATIALVLVAALFCWMRFSLPVSAELRRRLGSFPYSLAEVYSANPGPVVILEHLQRMPRSGHGSLTDQDRQTLLTILQREDLSWYHVQTAALDLLEKCGDGSEVKALRRFARRSAFVFLAESHYLAKRSKRLLPILEARAKERKGLAQLLRPTARDDVSTSLLHPAVNSGVGARIRSCEVQRRSRPIDEARVWIAMDRRGALAGHRRFRSASATDATIGLEIL